MKFWFFLMLLMPATIQALPFNITLPTNMEYSPGVLNRGEKSVWLGLNNEHRNFQLQVRSQDDVEHFLGNDDSKTGFSYGFSYGLGGGLEASIYGSNDTANLAIQYDFDHANSRWRHSVIAAYISGTSYGHSGTVLDTDECGFLDLFCFLDLSRLFCFWDCNTDTYEYYYEAKTNGGLLAYIQGFRVSPEFVPYWGIYTMDYNIHYNVHDNVNGSETGNGSLTTDMSAIVLGAKWLFGKGSEHKPPMSMSLNYVLMSGSSRHDGNVDGDLRLLFRVAF